MTESLQPIDVDKAQALHKQASKGLLWSGMERFGQQGTVFLVQLVLARLLTPEHFGLVAMVTVFTSVARVIVDSGLSRALIQKHEIFEEDLSTVFYANLVISAVIVALLLLAAPAIARFYEQATLIPVIQVLAMSLLLGALGSVPHAVLSRRLAFDQLFRVTLPATAIAGILSITLAFYGVGVWALVVNLLVATTLRSLMLLLVARWYPRTGFHWDSFKSVFPYGSRLALAGMLDQGFQNIYILVIGKIYLPADAGFFQRARLFQQFPVSNIGAIVVSVAFPIFSSLQQDKTRLKKGARTALLLCALVTCPLMGWLFSVAEPLVITLVGEKWIASVSYLKVLCFVGMLYPVHLISMNLINALGRSDYFLKLEVIKKILFVANIAIACQYGILAMIYGMIAISIVGLWLNAIYTKRLLAYSLWEQLQDAAPGFAITALVMVVDGVAGLYLDLDMLPKLLVLSFLTAVVCLAGMKLLPQSTRAGIRGMLSSVRYGDVLGKFV